MTNEGYLVVSRMVAELSTCKYGYRNIVEGCYEACINNYHMTKPTDSRDDIVDKALEILNR